MGDDDQVAVVTRPARRLHQYPSAGREHRVAAVTRDVQALVRRVLAGDRVRPTAEAVGRPSRPPARWTESRLARASTRETSPPTVRRRVSRLSSSVRRTPKVLSGDPIIAGQERTRRLGAGRAAAHRTVANHRRQPVDGCRGGRVPAWSFPPRSDSTPCNDEICPVSSPVAARKLSFSSARVALSDWRRRTSACPRSHGHPRPARPVRPAGRRQSPIMARELIVTRRTTPVERSASRPTV